MPELKPIPVFTIALLRHRSVYQTRKITRREISFMSMYICQIRLTFWLMISSLDTFELLAGTVLEGAGDLGCALAIIDQTHKSKFEGKIMMRSTVIDPGRKRTKAIRNRARLEMLSAWHFPLYLG